MLFRDFSLRFFWRLLIFSVAKSAILHFAIWKYSGFSEIAIFGGTEMWRNKSEAFKLSLQRSIRTENWTWSNKSVNQNWTEPQGLSGTPQPQVFSQKYRRYKWEAYCVTNGRRSAVEIGGVLRRFPFSKALKPARHSVTNGGRSAVQIGGVPPVLSDKLHGLGVPKQSPEPLPTCLCESEVLGRQMKNVGEFHDRSPCPKNPSG